MKFKIFIFFLVGLLLLWSPSRVEGAELAVKTLHPSSIPYVYYTLKDSRGTTLAYKKIPGRESQNPTLLVLSKWQAGQVRLECSYGKFIGSIDFGGKIHFSHQYIQQKEDEITLMNQLNIKLTLRTSSPSMMNQVEYLFLTNSGLVVRKNIPGSSSDQPLYMVVRNIIPCYGHLSTSFGQFVVQVQNQKVVFVYRGVRRAGTMEVSVEGGQNFLTLKGVSFTGKEPDTSAVVPKKTLGAVFSLPPQIEANERGGARISLDGSKSKFPPGSRYFWKFSGGFREGIHAEILLPLGKHKISLTVSKDSMSDTLDREVSIRDTLPPDIEGKYLPVPMPGRSLYRLQIQAWDTVDPNPQIQGKISLLSGKGAPPKFLSNRISSLTFSPQGLLVQGPDPQQLFSRFQSQGGIPLQDGQLVEIVPSGEPFKIIWKEDDTMLWEGKIPKIFLESRDKAGNGAKKKLVFEISSPQIARGSKGESSEPEVLDQGPSPLTILLSVLACFLIFGILFFRKS